MSDSVAPPGAPDIAAYAPSPQELDTLHNSLKVVDPEQKGITANMLRPFYPRDGWHKIFARLQGLVDTNRVVRRKRGQPVPLEYFTWQ